PLRCGSSGDHLRMTSAVKAHETVCPLAGCTCGVCASGACTSDSPTGVPAIRIDVAPSPVTLETDETRQLTATVRSTSGTVIDHATVTWSSTSALVATVTQAGLVTAVGKGTTQIQATF